MKYLPKVHLIFIDPNLEFAQKMTNIYIFPSLAVKARGLYMNVAMGRWGGGDVGTEDKNIKEEGF